jgi:hypothetical protein
MYQLKIPIEPAEIGKQKGRVRSTLQRFFLALGTFGRQRVIMNVYV